MLLNCKPCTFDRLPGKRPERGNKLTLCVLEFAGRRPMNLERSDHLLTHSHRSHAERPMSGELRDPRQRRELGTRTGDRLE